MLGLCHRESEGATYAAPPQGNTLVRTSCGPLRWAPSRAYIEHGAFSGGAVMG